MVVGVAEAECVAGDELDHAVDPLTLGVAVSGADERGDLGPPAVDGGGELADFGDGEPGQDVGDGAALDASEQPAVAEGVDEAGVSSVPGQAPFVGLRIPLPAGPSAAGLVDAQDCDPRQRCLGDVAGLRAEGFHHGRPGQMQIPRDLDDRGAGIPYAAPGRTPQSGGQSGTGRDLRDLFGEGSNVVSLSKPVAPA